MRLSRNLSVAVPTFILPPHPIMPHLAVVHPSHSGERGVIAALHVAGWSYMDVKQVLYPCNVSLGTAMARSLGITGR